MTVMSKVNRTICFITFLLLMVSAALQLDPDSSGNNPTVTPPVVPSSNSLQ